MRGLGAVVVAVVVTLAAGAAGSTTSVSGSHQQAGAGLPTAVVEYSDPAGRFTFTYAASFGGTSVGTNNGFGDRVAALRFSTLSPRGPGGEAVLTRGRPLFDVQLAGGLYDPFAREALTDGLLTLVDGVLPALTPATFCDALQREEHVDVNHSAFEALTAAQRAALRLLDRTGNVGPRVLDCVVDGAMVTFLKEAALTDGAPRRQVFGAVRFLEPPYSTFQIVQARATVDAQTRADIARAVASWRPGTA